jgi:uncharacterized membrane protein
LGRPGAEPRANCQLMSTQVRFDRLDALRGVAIVWMAVFHFCFDLNHFGFLVPKQMFTSDPFWTTQRSCIVSLFLFCAGIGQAIALEQGQSWTRFWKRWAQIAGCAVLVSIGSAWMFPRSWISFGVLHGIAVMLILVRVLAPLRSGLWLIGAAAIVLPLLWRHEFFNDPWWRWVGLVTRKPVTEDYVPILPWLGVVAWGLAAGQWLQRHAPGVLAGHVPRAARALAWLGRWSLSFYMVHQPVLIGALMALVALRR